VVGNRVFNREIQGSNPEVSKGAEIVAKIDIQP
jgi:hypothetical protein